MQGKQSGSKMEQKDEEDTKELKGQKRKTKTASYETPETDERYFY
ncbi:uncharacterized protein NP_3094A [Natronomonas pharaonis DSM 2160]|uniref:Uncharacterized protein n=1 Tax=Natronomonas pharaonis (strain ATCC 35678 / DSM 2160 / CIP 103997 / JCM 8858 / NBRC 14720 / NCIMB 2260 / Gabara) TaxID=348780 RepID=A0A1U7EX01_NATPD|nr:uncharacterized protein NP_3094A [Natronomonas pharaonis DSM 2160]